MPLFHLKDGVFLLEPLFVRGSKTTFLIQRYGFLFLMPYQVLAQHKQLRRFQTKNIYLRIFDQPAVSCQASNRVQFLIFAW